MSVKASSWSQKKLMERLHTDGRTHWDLLKPYCVKYFQLQDDRTKFRCSIDGAPDDIQEVTKVGNKSVINLAEHTVVLGDKVRDVNGDLIVATLPEHLLPAFNEAHFSKSKEEKVKKPRAEKAPTDPSAGNVVEIPPVETVVIVTPAFAPVEQIVNAASVAVADGLIEVFEAPAAVLPTPLFAPVEPVAETVAEVAAVVEQPKEGLQRGVNNQIVLDLSVMPNYARQMNILSLSEAKARSFLVVGAGALGSEVVDTLSGMGIEPISSYDHDIVDAVNIPIQKVYELPDIGKPKVHALAARVMRKNGIVLQAHHERFENQPLARIVISCVDSIAGRRAIFNRCKNNPAVDFFIDGRMGKLYGKVYALNPSDADQVSQYEKTLKDKPGQVAAAGCSQDIILFAPVLIANAMAMAAVHHMIGEPVKWEQHFVMNKIGLYTSIRADDITAGGEKEINPELFSD